MKIKVHVLGQQKNC